MFKYKKYVGLNTYMVLNNTLVRVSTDVTFKCMVSLEETFWGIYEGVYWRSETACELNLYNSIVI